MFFRNIQKLLDARSLQTFLSQKAVPKADGAELVPYQLLGAGEVVHPSFRSVDDQLSAVSTPIEGTKSYFQALAEIYSEQLHGYC